jgi:hypothetical protein
MTIRAMALCGAVAAAIAGCGGDDDPGRSPVSSGCEAPELQDFTISVLEVEGASCATGGAVAAAASECYFGSATLACPEVVVGGTRWDCSFSVVGPSGSGGLAEAVCLGHGGPEVRFETQRRVA